MTRILIGPRRTWLVDAIEEGGATVVDDGPADAVVWTDPHRPGGLRTLLDEQPDIAWVQLPWAGIEPFVDVLDDDRVWTCGKGVYADPVAEQALLFALMGLRGMATYAHAQTWEAPEGHNLLGATVTIVGGGGIAQSLLRLLEPFDVTTNVVRRTAAPTLDDLDSLLPASDVVVLALPLTSETEGLFDERRLRLLPDHAWLVNVARGGHVVTDDLVTVLREGAIGGAGLDVTDPEPLPDGHPLWSLPNCFISPHVGNTPEMAVPLLRARVRENVRRFIAGEALIGRVHVDAGYLSLEDSSVVKITEIDHVVLNVADARRSLEFYRDVLGLEPLRLAEWEAGEAPFVSVHVHGGCIIDLMEIERSGENADHLCLVVEDDIDQLIADGTITPEAGPMDLYGARGQGHSVYLRDPDGNRVELRNYR